MPRVTVIRVMVTNYHRSLPLLKNLTLFAQTTDNLMGLLQIDYQIPKR